MKTIEVNIDDVVHLMRGGKLELEQFEIVVRREDLESVRDMLPSDQRTDEPCPPFKPLFGETK